MSSEKTIRFARNFFNSENKITYIGSGSFGGKAQSLIDINDVLNEKIETGGYSNIAFSIPALTVLRTGIFDAFIKRNKLQEMAFSDERDDRIAHAFQKADLPFEILGDLRAIVNEVHSPLAIRSSSMLEDAKFEPFAGIYETKMIPNNQNDADTRFKKLVEAIKFVYSSTFFKAAKSYITATKHRIEEEKMAIIIQEVVGDRHKERFYPELSGVARSFNFYPMGRAKPEDGIVNLALGLGKTIVDGGISWGYSPKYPQINPPFSNVGEMLKMTQTKFWAVNMGKPPAYDPILETEYLLEENITQADRDNTLKYVASTLDRHSGRVTIGTGPDGPRILTFSPILQMDDIPLNDLLQKAMSICEEEMQTPVEIEFAVTFKKEERFGNKFRFGFLQVRPMVVSTEKIVIDKSELSGPAVIAASEHALGNGMNEVIRDIIFVKPEIFEAKYTSKIAVEIDALNRKMLTAERPFLLIGFGRWGSSDPWLGIPVNWGQVAGAKAIVEATLPKMNIELSQGSHFFQNLTSFNVSYFSIPFSAAHKINWDWLNRQHVEEDKSYTRHVSLAKPLRVKVDGRSGLGLIAHGAE